VPLRRASEHDDIQTWSKGNVMAVLAMMRKKLNVDPN
jgi:hypothetical protein